MTYRYFPIREAELAANIQYFSLKEEVMDLGDGIVVKAKYLNHPVLCLRYRSFPQCLYYRSGASGL